MREPLAAASRGSRLPLGNPRMAENVLEQAKRVVLLAWRSGWLAHSVRTTVATAASLEVARLFKMPEAYWASVTTLIVMQSTLGAAWAVSRLRLIGTALGAALGALLASYFSPRRGAPRLDTTAWQGKVWPTGTG